MTSKSALLLLVLVVGVRANAFQPLGVAISHRLPPDAIVHRRLSALDPLAMNLPSRSALLGLRGGASFKPGHGVLTFTQNLAGSVFSTFSTIYGLACIVAPERTAHLFYGYDEVDESNGDGGGARFLMRMMGSIACGIGLTSAFAIGAEIKAGLGKVPPPSTFDKSIGVGLIPRVLLVSYALVTGVPKNLRIVRKDAFVALLQTSLFIASMFTGKIVAPDSIILLEAAFHFLIGPLLFFKPSILFKDSGAPSKHEKFMTRMLASYSVMGAVLVASLQYPAINALPSIGLASVAWVASLVHFTFVRKDVKECGTSVPGHITMMAIGAAVAAGGLCDYLVV